MSETNKDIKEEVKSAETEKPELDKTETETKEVSTEPAEDGQTSIPSGIEQLQPDEEIVAPETPTVEDVYYDPDYATADDPAATKEAVEKQAAEVNASYKTLKRVQLIITCVCAAMAIALVVVMFQNNESLRWLSYLMVGLVIVAFVVTMIISSKLKKKTMAGIESFIHSYILTIDGLTFGSIPDLDNVRIAPQGQVDNNNVINAHYYETILSVASRNKAIGTFKGINFTLVDVSLSVPANPAEAGKARGRQKNSSLGFYGKWLALDHKIPMGGIIICRQSESHTLTAAPTYLDGYEAVEVEGLDDHFMVFATDASIAAQFMTPEVKEALTALIPGEQLLDYLISVNANGTYFGLNYADPIVAAPLTEKVKLEAYEEHLSAIKGMFKVLDAIIGE